ncbi:uncharacterized protein LOC129146547 isoform X3 [Talpa occidentalis]|uniref:uncharacterized protein LOC129146547 isoform X3 n=1 Tax=Talpa occidentalis TaxID=50954 RepID=UPI0023F6B4CC|nr:uncharacterized protein LOC129146547 isoform X3 [Talpa occidentalis]
MEPGGDLEDAHGAERHVKKLRLPFGPGLGDTDGSRDLQRRQGSCLHGQDWTTWQTKKSWYPGTLEKRKPRWSLIYLFIYTSTGCSQKHGSVREFTRARAGNRTAQMNGNTLLRGAVGGRRGLSHHVGPSTVARDPTGFAKAVGIFAAQCSTTVPPGEALI